MKNKLFKKFKEKLLELYYIGSTIAILNWDRDVFMPVEGSNLRAEKISYLAGLLHEKFLAKDFEKMLKELKKEMDKKNLSPKESAIIKEVWREFEKEKKLPLEFVKELSEICSKAQGVWMKAREKSDFKMFQPYLKKIIKLKKQEAEYIGYKNSPYDALLDVYEPEMTTQEIYTILEDLKNFLIPFIKQIKNSKVKINPKILKGNFPISKQKKFDKLIAKKIGFNFESGRLDVSTHPFTTSFHPSDVRITTRFDKNDLFYSVSSTMHEVGHALYEQGILPENFGTPLGESISLGIHESQSRVWENIIGKNKLFWKYFYPILQKEFSQPFLKVKLEDFYNAINYVKPSLIRTEADEVTYNLHIIMRFEIEKDLIEGKIKVEDLPKIWNSKMKEYFGINVPNDRLGILQDVHWSCGSIGYFPTYSLGNLYSSQFYNAAKKDILNLEKEISSGNFKNLREWFRKNIHIHGKFYSASELVKKVTGEKLNNKYFINYIKNKYSEIYKLS
jgi:carboxypeptidase Taq